MLHQGLKKQRHFQPFTKRFSSLCPEKDGNCRTCLRGVSKRAEPSAPHQEVQTTPTDHPIVKKFRIMSWDNNDLGPVAMLILKLRSF